jgi:hypothetical protein
VRAVRRLAAGAEPAAGKDDRTDPRRQLRHAHRVVQRLRTEPAHGSPVQRRWSLLHFLGAAACGCIALGIWWLARPMGCAANLGLVVCAALAGWYVPLGTPGATAAAAVYFAVTLPTMVDRAPGPTSKSLTMGFTICTVVCMLLFELGGSAFRDGRALRRAAAEAERRRLPE